MHCCTVWEELVITYLYICGSSGLNWLNLTWFNLTRSDCVSYDNCIVFTRMNEELKFTNPMLCSFSAHSWPTSCILKRHLFYLLTYPQHSNVCSTDSVFVLRLHFGKSYRKMCAKSSFEIFKDISATMNKNRKI